MYNNKKIVAIIPARSGSKRLKNKNIMPINGKPLVSWTIEAAKNSKYIDEVFISTDSEDIYDIACSYNYEPIEMRPDYLSGDTTTTLDVLVYSIEKGLCNGDVLVLLQPTSPLRNQHHIDEALELYFESNAINVISVTPCEHSPLWSNTLPADMSMKNFLKIDKNLRSQDLDKYYRLNGAIYIYNVNSMMSNKGIEYDNTYAFIMDRKSSVDIDCLDDFNLAEFYFMKGNI